MTPGLALVSVLAAVAAAAALGWARERRRRRALEAERDRALRVLAGAVGGGGAGEGALEAAAREAAARAAAEAERAERGAAAAAAPPGVRLEIDTGNRVRAAHGDPTAAGLAAALAGRPLLDAVPSVALLEAVEAVRAAGLPRSLRLPPEPPRTRPLEARVAPVAGHPGEVVVHLADASRLEALERAARDLVANLAHELRTPLAAIRGAGETLADPSLAPADARRFAAMVLRHAARLEALARDLGILADLDAGLYRIRHETVSIADLCRAALEPFAGAAAERGVRLELEAEEGTARADPQALGIALGNLLENALRHTPRGGVVRLRASREERGWTIEVADTGSGIPAIHLDRVFERFYRADAGRDARGGGRGLGLAIVRGLVEALGGRVEIESRVGEGTRVRMRLPEPPPAGPASAA